MSAKETARKNQTKTAEASKPYNNSFQSLIDIWDVLDRYASAEHPMTVREIYENLQEKDAQATPSLNTVSRQLPAQTEALGTLFPHQVLMQNGRDGAEQAYVHGGKMHVVLENRAGDAFWDGEMAVVLQPRPATTPSYATIDKLLQKFPQSEGEFPFRLKCVMAKTTKGRTRYIPYASWEAQYEGDDVPHNQPRRYYLEGVLTNAEWRMLSDLVQVYPYISEAQTDKFLQVLSRLAPGGGTMPGTRYAFKRGNEKQFRHLEVLDAAIRRRKKVQIRYGTYVLEDVNGECRPVLQQRESAGLLTIDPYVLMWSNGYYYLVGKNVGMMNLRVDRILSVAELKEDFIRDAGFDPYIYRDKSPVMYPGTPQYVRLRCHTSLISTVLDFFGPQPHFTKPREGWTEVSMSIAPAGVRLFAMQYADKVEVLEPKELREEIGKQFAAAAERYR